jgi:hypothetical protein
MTKSQKMALKILKRYYPDPIDVKGFEDGWLHELRENVPDDTHPPWVISDYKHDILYKYIYHRDEKSKLKSARSRLDYLVKRGYVEKIPPGSRPEAYDYVTSYRLKNQYKDIAV